MDPGVHFGIKLWRFVLGGVILLSLLQAGCQAEPTLTLTLGGDVILGRDGEAIFAHDPWGEIAPAETFTDSSQNLFMVNLESPLGSSTGSQFGSKEGYNLCAPSEAAAILKLGGVDLVSVANNHRFDCKENADLSQAMPGISYASEGHPIFLETPAGRVAIIAVDAVSKPLDMTTLLAIVTDMRAEADLLIVSLHWGVEYAGEPTPLQREQAKQLANAGVDVLWGHHPHVLQPAEWVDSEDGKHRMLALYSLGNLLSDQMMTFETRHSALIQLQFKGGEINQMSLQPLVLTQKDGRLVLAYPDEAAVKQISNRLGWEDLLDSFK